MAVSSAYLARKAAKAEKSGKSSAKADLKNSGLSKDEELKAYYDMLLIRRFEEKAGQLYGMHPRQHLCQYRGTAFVVDHNGIRPLPVE